MSSKYLTDKIHKHKGLNFLHFLFRLLESIGSTTASLMLMGILDELIAGNLSGFVKSGVLTVIVWFAAIGLSSIAARIQASCEQKVSKELRMDIVRGVSNANLQEFNKREALDYSAMLQTNVDMVETRMTKNYYTAAGYIIDCIVSAIALIYLHYSLLILVIILLVLMMIVPSLFSNKLQKSAQNISSSQEKMVSRAGHWFSGFSVLNDFQRKNILVDKVEPDVSEVYDAKVGDSSINVLVSAVIGLLSMISQLSLILLAGYLAIVGKAPNGAIMSVGNIAGSIFSQVSAISRLYTQYNSGIGVLNKIEEIASTKDVVEVKESTSKVKDVVVSAKDLTYQFEGRDKLTYPEMNLTSGKNYAISGPSGVGKSVFLNILSKNLEGYSGNLSINGREVSSLSETDVKGQVGYVQQSTYIFNLSLKDNITLLDDSISREAFDNAIRLSGLYELVSELPNGADTIIGSTGVKLSGGQAQRVGIARALVRNKSILLFDEVTANLDKETALGIEEEIANIPNALKISINHHLSDKNKEFYDEIIEFK